MARSSGARSICSATRSPAGRSFGGGSAVPCGGSCGTQAARMAGVHREVVFGDACVLIGGSGGADLCTHCGAVSGRRRELRRMSCGDFVKRTDDPGIEFPGFFVSGSGGTECREAARCRPQRLPESDWRGGRKDGRKGPPLWSVGAGCRKERRGGIERRRVCRAVPEGNDGRAHRRLGRRCAGAHRLFGRGVRIRRGESSGEGVLPRGDEARGVTPIESRAQSPRARSTCSTMSRTAPWPPRNSET